MMGMYESENIEFQEAKIDQLIMQPIHRLMYQVADTAGLL